MGDIEFNGTEEVKINPDTGLPYTEEDLMMIRAVPAGGRRHKGSKKMHKGKRHGNASLKAWVTFVKKVQKEEGVSYKEAMMRAKKRKDHGEKWRGGGEDDDESRMTQLPQDGSMSSLSWGGRRRRRRTRRRSRSSRRSRSHRRSRRHH